MFTNITIAVAALAVPAISVQVPAPKPVVLVAKWDMPQFIPGRIVEKELESNQAQSAVALYHQLRTEFSLSTTVMSEWLGVKRRTLYNWINNPSKSKQYGSQIEKRLAVLLILKNEMEPEHRAFLRKIAFSPIYGNPDFGGLILSGASDIALVEYYDELYSQFESYRKLSARALV